MAKTSVMPFAGLLRQLRTEAGLTQEELAGIAGVGARSISDLERGVALTARRDTARRLADALGLAGAARIAFDSVARGRPAARGVGGGAVAAATRTLPRDITSFTGRKVELRQLIGTAAVRPCGVVEIHAIGGMAGVGKTALAVHAGHQLASRFPDGQIFLRLHGHTPGRSPVDPADALVSLLQTTGVAPAQIPLGFEARIALWRDRLADKRMLLLLDDAVGSEQVRPLLPGAAGCLVLVTSRRHLTALEDAQAISLDMLPPDEAAELLIRLASRPGLEASDPAVAEITRLCGYLPLAVGMLGRQLHHHPAWTAAELAADLSVARDRLEFMQAENLSVTAAFDLSYRDLTENQQRLFRRLGLHPGTDIDAYAAAALDCTDVAQARRNLDALYDQCLIDEPARGRYRLHDLIRQHARALAAMGQPAENEAAENRLLDYYLHAATSAESRIARQSRPGRRSRASSPIAIPDLHDRTRALNWARAERANLLACLDRVSNTGQPARIVGLTAAIAALLRHDGPWTEAISRHTAAVKAAREIDDRLGQAGALNDLGDVRWAAADYPRASQALEAALKIYRDLGDQLGQANALGNLGAVGWVIADYPRATQALEEALDKYHDLGDQLGEANTLLDLGAVRGEASDFPGSAQALEAALGIYRDLGDQRGQANALGNLGVVRRLIGDYQGAAAAHQEQLEIFHDLANRKGQATALVHLGAVRQATGDYSGASKALEAASGIFLDLGDQLGQAVALGHLGVVRRLTGNYRQATEAHKEQLDIYRGFGNREGEAEALNELGTLYRLGGELNEANACHGRALQLAREIGAPWIEAHALAGQARDALAAGRTEDAEAGLRQARDIFQRIGAADAVRVAAELDALTEIL